MTKKTSAILTLMSYFSVLCLILTSCESNDSKAFAKIDCDDLNGYENFLEEYPNSKYSNDAKERIEAIIMAKETQRQQQLIEEYGQNSLESGDQPYAQWYGRNNHYDTPHSEIKVKAPHNSDVIVIVRYNNENGNVAGHIYITAGSEETIQLENNHTYQTFFYYGKGWFPDKEMDNGIKGGFVRDESFSKDGTPILMSNNIVSYKLIPAGYENFRNFLK